MRELVKGVGIHVSDGKVNELSGKHLEDAQLLEVKWDSTASALKDEQLREYRNFIHKLYEGNEVSIPSTPM